MKDSFNDLSYGELLTRRDEMRKQYRDVRFNVVVGHVDNPLLLRTLKRKLARLNTILHEYDLGIRQAQAAVTGAEEAGGKEENEQPAAAPAQVEQ
ncbi:MAG: 50S ribosomal protein L29 [Spirochaetaceae bacterium]|nr:50S ribosomal protein L29 [Spirochaetaceae bacterium]